MSVLNAKRRLAPLLLACSGWLVLALTVFGGIGPLRAIAVFAFALTCPGLAIVRLLPLTEPLERVVVAVAMSLSLATLAAEAMYIAHVLRPALILAMLAAVCTAAAAPEAVRGVKARW